MGISPNGYMVTCDSTGRQATVEKLGDIPENWIRLFLSFESYTKLSDNHYKVVDGSCDLKDRCEYFSSGSFDEFTSPESLYFCNEKEAALFVLEKLGFRMALEILKAWDGAKNGC